MIIIIVTHSEIISILKYPAFRRVLSNPYKEHIIGRMLAPPATLVYLTLQKGDIFQAKHVIKMFDLKGNELLFFFFFLFCIFV